MTWIIGVNTMSEKCINLRLKHLKMDMNEWGKRMYVE